MRYATVPIGNSPVLVLTPNYMQGTHPMDQAEQDGRDWKEYNQAEQTARKPEVDRAEQTRRPGDETDRAEQLDGRGQAEQRRPDKTHKVRQSPTKQGSV